MIARMKRIHLTENNLSAAVAEAAAVLCAGGLVLYPTETLYGVAVNAMDPAAVDKLLAFKKRPAGKAVSVLVPGLAEAAQLVEIGGAERIVFERFLPGPVTLVVKDRGCVDGRLVSELGTLGIRISSHPVAAALAQAAGVPLTATSANAAGAARPYDIATALAGLSSRQRAHVDLVLDAGSLPRREPSSVIDLTGGIQRVVRAGEAVRDLAQPLQTSSEDETRAIARETVRSLFHAVREKPVVLALSGEMGMGKTQFAKGVAEALGVSVPVTSPSFVVMKEYDGTVEGRRVRFVHMDCWRVGEVRSSELGLDDYLQPGTLLVIEWPAPLLEWLRSLGEAAVVHHYEFREYGDMREIVLTDV